MSCVPQSRRVNDNGFTRAISVRDSVRSFARPIGLTLEPKTASRVALRATWFADYAIFPAFAEFTRCRWPIPKKAPIVEVRLTRAGFKTLGRAASFPEEPLGLLKPHRGIL